QRVDLRAGLQYEPLLRQRGATSLEGFFRPKTGVSPQVRMFFSTTASGNVSYGYQGYADRKYAPASAGAIVGNRGGAHLGQGVTAEVFLRRAPLMDADGDGIPNHRRLGTHFTSAI